MTHPTPTNGGGERQEKTMYGVKVGWQGNVSEQVCPVTRETKCYVFVQEEFSMRETRLDRDSLPGRTGGWGHFWGCTRDEAYAAAIEGEDKAMDAARVKLTEAEKNKSKLQAALARGTGGEG